MKSVLIAWAILAAGQAALAAPNTIIISNRIGVVAAQLHKAIPAHAPNELFEARRIDGGWLYTYWIRAGKIWVEEVEIRLNSNSFETTRVVVNAYRKENGTFFTSKKEMPALKMETTEWIQDLLNVDTLSRAQ